MTRAPFAVPLVPGPTRVWPEVLSALGQDYPSPDREADYVELLLETEGMLQRILGTASPVVIMTGEATLALWSALKSTLTPGDRVLSVVTGPVSAWIADVARSVTGDVREVAFPAGRAADPGEIRRAVQDHGPRMVTVVHCESPAGVMNPVDQIGPDVKSRGVELLLVDAVSTAAGAPVEADAWGIDLCVVGTQKCLSAPPDQAILAVSRAAWAAAERVQYAGYDALLPWREASREVGRFPYTPSWSATAALAAACHRVLDEGLDVFQQRHADVARYARERARRMELALFPEEISTSSPTVTAIEMPDGLDWQTLNDALRGRGVAVGGAWGELADEVFRIGHMGSQADLSYVKQGMDALAEVLASFEKVPAW